MRAGFEVMLMGFSLCSFIRMMEMFRSDFSVGSWEASEDSFGIGCGARWENCRLAMLLLDRGMNSIHTLIASGFIKRNSLVYSSALKRPIGDTPVHEVETVRNICR